jgi:hypothetical protein
MTGMDDQQSSGPPEQRSRNCLEAIAHSDSHLLLVSSRQYRATPVGSELLAPQLHAEPTIYGHLELLLAYLPVDDAVVSLHWVEEHPDCALDEVDP